MLQLRAINIKRDSHQRPVSRARGSETCSSPDMQAMDKTQYADTMSHPTRPASGLRSCKRALIASGAVVLATIWLTCPSPFQSPLPFVQRKAESAFDKAQRCAIDNLHGDLSFLDRAKPITADEFVSRRDNLARALAASEVDAFVLEPGYTFQYLSPLTV